MTIKRSNNIEGIIKEIEREGVATRQSYTYEFGENGEIIKNTSGKVTVYATAEEVKIVRDGMRMRNYDGEERTEETMSTEISRDEAANIVNEWNAKIDAFMTQELPKLLEADGIRVKNGKISLNSWFKANEIINKQNFYQKGHEIQMKLRDAGHDVKMNMQDHTLVFPKWW